jgi:hypothetical protein
MGKKEVFRYQVRTFLNADKDLRAYVMAHVRKSEVGEPYSNIRLEIGDCARYINLDFDFDNDAADIKKIEKKIKLFRSIINDFADAVEAELEFMKAQPKRVKKKKKNQTAC